LNRCDLISAQTQNVKALVCKSIKTGFSCGDFYDTKIEQRLLEENIVY